MRRDAAERPFEQLHMDFADHAGRKYLIAIDGYSGWLFVANLGTSAPVNKLISAVRDIFCRVGVPDVIWSDGGTQFTSAAFQAFLRDWQIRHKRSSPMYPQSNGKAESAVKAAKKLLRRCWSSRDQRLDPERWTRGILQLRNTPGPDGPSPAQLVYGRPVQDALPAHRRQFAASWQRASDAVDAAAASRRERIEQAYNQHSRDLPELNVGNQVAVWDPKTHRWDRYGVVVELQPFRRYLVRLTSGRLLARNRRHLRRRYGHALPDNMKLDATSQAGSPGPHPHGHTQPDNTPLDAMPQAGSPGHHPRDQHDFTPAEAEPTQTTTSQAPGNHGPDLPRRSQRTRRRPRRLIEEM